MTYSASWAVLLPTVCSGFDESPYEVRSGEYLPAHSPDPETARSETLLFLRFMFKEEPASIAILIQANQTP